MEADLTGVVLDGRYRVIEPISEGAMGAVYRAERLKLGRIVAIKILHDELPAELSSRKRFEIEATAMAKLEHPHCAAVIDVGVHEDKPFVVMDFVSGDNLRDVIANGPLPLSRAVEIVRQVLSGLAHAHEHGIIHRDIKPANIVLSQKAGLGDHVKILDFGLARLTAPDVPKLTTGIVVGTPAYMAPEQIRGVVIDHRADLYACGVLLFELLTGKKPFVSEKDDPVEVCSMHLKNPPPTLAQMQPGIDYGPLEAIVARALSKKAEDRYPTAVEFAEALDAVPRAATMRRSAPIAVATPQAVASETGWAVPEGAKSSMFPGDVAVPGVASGPAPTASSGPSTAPTAAPIAASGPNTAPTAAPSAASGPNTAPAVAPNAASGPSPTGPNTAPTAAPNAASGPNTAPAVAPIAASGPSPTGPNAAPSSVSGPNTAPTVPPAAPMAWVAPGAAPPVAAPAAIPSARTSASPGAAPPVASTAPAAIPTARTSASPGISGVPLATATPSTGPVARGGKLPPAPFARPTQKSAPRTAEPAAPSAIDGGWSGPVSAPTSAQRPASPSTAPVPATSPAVAGSSGPTPTAIPNAPITAPVGAATAPNPAAFDPAAAIAAAEAAAKAVSQASPPAKGGLPSDFDLSVAIPRGAPTGANEKGLSPAFDLSLAIPSPPAAPEKGGFDLSGPQVATPILERSGSVSGPTASPASGPTRAKTGSKPPASKQTETKQAVTKQDVTMVGLVAIEPKTPGVATAAPDAVTQIEGGSKQNAEPVTDGEPDHKATVAFLGAPPAGPSPLEIADVPAVAEPVALPPPPTLPALPVTKKQLQIIGIGAAVLILLAIIIGTCGGKKSDKAKSPETAAATRNEPDEQLSPQDEQVKRINELIDAGKKGEAIEQAVGARKVFPRDARLSYVLGKLYFERQSWNAGLKQFRDTLEIDPTYRSDPDLIKAALKAFLTPADYPTELGAFLRNDIGPPARQYLEETASKHPRAATRARAKAELAKMQ